MKFADVLFVNTPYGKFNSFNKGDITKREDFDK